MDAHFAGLEDAMSEAISEAVRLRHLDPMTFVAEVLHRKATAAAGATTEAAPALERISSSASDRAWSIKGWLRSLDLEAAIGEALSSGSQSSTELERMHSISFAELKERLEAAHLRGHAPAIWEHLQVLRNQAASTGSELNQKFQAEANFTLAYGALDTFFLGLEGTVGPPLVLSGSLLRSMEVEHCDAKDSAAPFTSSNGLTTCSKVEYELVTCPKLGKLYPERESLPPVHPHRRNVWDLERLQREIERINECLRADKHTELIIEEAVGGRLYTGPMYEKYNAVLRFFSGKARYDAAEEIPFLQRKCASLGLGSWAEIQNREGTVVARVWQWANKFATTIHAINSLVLKCSKLTVATTVYRGLSNAALPAAFWEVDEFRLSGGVEFGFTSTSTDRAQAASYAEAGNASTLLEMAMGLVDRGASLRWLSQYLHEDYELP